MPSLSETDTALRTSHRSVVLSPGFRIIWSMLNSPITGGRIRSGAGVEVEALVFAPGLVGLTLPAHAKLVRQKSNVAKRNRVTDSFREAS